MFCPQCGNSNDISAKFCSGCGFTLPQIGQEAPNAHAGTKASSNQEEFYKAAIGPKNQSYYLSIFQRFENDGKAGVSWHWPAFFITFYWLLYRKMWRNALIYFFLPYLVMIPLVIIGAMAGNAANAVIGFGYFLYLVGIFLLPPLYANTLYYQHCNKKIIEAKASSHDMQRQLGELSGKGGTSNVALIIVLVFAFIAAIGILAAIAIPAYQDYTTRARLAEAASVGNSAAESIAQYYYQHQAVPSSLDVAGFTASLPSSVKNIAVDSQNGIVSITMATAPIEGKELLLVPSLDTNNQITWKCMSLEIPDKYLPRQCLQQQ